MKELKRFAYLDSLRGIAIILVLIAHTAMRGDNSGLPSWFIRITSIDIGPRGVQLFFVVSAYTLCLSYASRKKFEKHYVKNFYLRRFFRIAPLFYIAVLFYAFTGMVFENANFSFLNILTTLTFTNGFFPNYINSIVFGGWSIAIEAMFYLIFPFLFSYLTSIRKTVLVTFFCMVILQVVRLIFLSLPFVSGNPDLQTYTFQFFPSQFPVFLIGILFYSIHQKIPTKREGRLVTVFFMLVLVLAVSQYIFRVKIIAGHYIYALIFGALLHYLHNNPFKFLVNSFTAYVGKISFSVYLCHTAIFALFSFFGFLDIAPKLPFVNYFFRLFLVSLFSFSLGSILHFELERRGIAYGKRIIDKEERKNTQTSSLLK